MKNYFIIIVLIALSNILAVFSYSSQFVKVKVSNDLIVGRRTSIFRHFAEYASTGIITYRNAQLEDIDQISQLCSVTFDGPFDWYMVLQKAQSLERFRLQLSTRFYSFVESGLKHAMFVAVKNNAVIGFVEIGMLPPPTRKPDGTMNATDYPYLGNLAVNKEERRQGIGRKLVKLGIKVANKWGDDKLFAAVKMDNIEAVRLYESLGFTLFLDESNEINRSSVNPPRLFYTIDTGPPPAL